MRVLVFVLGAGAVLAALAVVAVLGWMLVRPAQARTLVQGLFARPVRSKPVPPDHYYRTYWGGKSAA